MWSRYALWFLTEEGTQVYATGIKFYVWAL